MKRTAKILIGLVLIFTMISPPYVEAKDNGLMLVDSTGYYDIHDFGYGATGKPLIEGLTLAGKVSWLGKTAALYDEDMSFLGYYEFTDTGYGQSTGYGRSKILKGKTIGTIENGTCIDIYFNTKADCIKWGRRKVYMKLINAKG